MSLFVLDCSVTMAWCFEDQSDSYTDKVLESFAKGEGRVPSLWQLEVANVLLGAERRGRLQAADSSRFIELLKNLPIVMDEENPDRGMGPILSLGRKYGLTSYDATYLELAMRQGIALATCDKALREACKKSGVALF